MRSWQLTLGCLVLFGCCARPVPDATPGRYVWNQRYTSHAPAEYANTLRIPVWVDAQFDDGMQRAVSAALRGWNVALNGHAEYFVVSVVANPEKNLPAGDLGLAVVARSREEAQEADMGGALGWYDPDVENVVHLVTDRVGFEETRMREVCMHEIGHVLGLEHVEIKGTLMYPTWQYQAPCVDVVTARRVAEAMKWSYHTMNWCDP